MKSSRTILVLLAVVAASFSMAQAWSDAYSDGLRSVRDGNWMEARANFQKAISLRGEDQATPTRLPGPATEQRVWKNGSAYSPNFGAAYTGYKAAIANTNDSERTTLMRAVADEFEATLIKGQGSRETYFFLAQAYANLRDVAKQRDLEARFAQAGNTLKWKVDGDIIAPEDRATLESFGGTASNNSTITNAGSPIGAAPGTIAPIAEKFALLIGNTETRLEALKVPYAATDVMFLREKLVTFAGYQEGNMDVVTNGTAAQIRTTAQALADRVPVGSTIFLYFSGVGANLDGKDFLAGIDTSSGTDSASMLGKSDLYKMFMAKGCKIFAFFQVNRPIAAGRYFGMETPMVGAIAQTQATLPNEKVNSIVRNGAPVGLFTDALGGVLGEFRSNQVPIMEFGWRTFNWMRGGRNGDSGAGSIQTMTLPVIVNMKEDERF